MIPGFFDRKISLTASRLPKIPGISHELPEPSSSGQGFMAVKCRSSFWVELFACVQIQAIWSSTRSPAARPPWPSRRSWGASSSDLNSPRNTSNEVRHERRARDPVTRSTARLSRSSSARARRTSPRGERKKKTVTVPTSKENALDQEVVRAREHLIRAYESVYDGYSLDRVLADPELGSALTRKCHEVGLPGTPKDWNHLLMRLRKAGKLIIPCAKTNRVLLVGL